MDRKTIICHIETCTMLIDKLDLFRCGIENGSVAVNIYADAILIEEAKRDAWQHMLDHDR